MTQRSAADALAAIRAEVARAPTRDAAELADLAAAIDRARDRLATPMRVAVTGQIKRGKSTLVNGLLGAAVAPTGPLEKTFNVHEFAYGETPESIVHFTDGRPAQRVDVAELERYTSYDPARLDELRTVDRIVHRAPHKLLKIVHLVDTPGLNSIHGADSANARAAMGLDLVAATSAQIQAADAVLFLFSRGLHEHDAEVVRQFLGPGAGPGRVSPLRAFGVLSECDRFWPPHPDLPGEPDPLTFHPLHDHARKVLDPYRDRPDIRSLFYTIEPAAGLVAEGAQLLDDDDLTALDELAKAFDERELALLLGNLGGRFVAADLPCPVGPARRRALGNRLGAWGIHLACRFLRTGGSDAVALRTHLVQESGVARVRDLIVRHFGNRSNLIKIDQALTGVFRSVAQLRTRAGLAGTEVNPVAGRVATALERIRTAEHGLEEMAVLERYYNGELTLAPTDVKLLLEITGERGTSCMARLGLPESASIEEMSARARERITYWRNRSANAHLDYRTAVVARKTVRSYELLALRIRHARDILLYRADWPAPADTGGKPA